jgi:hypothetical protein
MGSISSGLAQVGSVTINGNQNVTGGSTWTYSIIGTSCSTANWIVNGGTVLSSNNISATVQWNNTSGNGSVQVSSYGCSPTPENRTGALSVTLNAPPYIGSPGEGRDCTAYKIFNLPGSCYLWTITFTDGTVDPPYTTDNPVSRAYGPNCGPYYGSKTVQSVCVRLCEGGTTYCQ